MDDLISRQAAIDALEREQSHIERPITETRWFDFGLKKAQDVLSKLPSAEPEIVRCKDCKYVTRCRSEESARKFGQIYECRRRVFDAPKSDDYCSKAER